MFTEVEQHSVASTYLPKSQNVVALDTKIILDSVRKPKLLSTYCHLIVLCKLFGKDKKRPIALN